MRQSTRSTCRIANKKPPLSLQPVTKWNYFLQAQVMSWIIFRFFGNKKSFGFPNNFTTKVSKPNTLGFECDGLRSTPHTHDSSGPLCPQPDGLTLCSPVPSQPRQPNLWRCLILRRVSKDRIFSWENITCEVFCRLPQQVSVVLRMLARYWCMIQYK